ncbi:uncharacterized protein LOC114791975 isoform X2 [Denticeps clupeoides]|uniref:uncharacterized protein LOC114791975 isoform X2 n=1 Tax=Denticeps clupeoides TaxID=299321 RepID=UPI0010A3FDA0|nr:uncharacterized protein LOC114791975 isoform X2 [Denticeps clupeoides]
MERPTKRRRVSGAGKSEDSQPESKKLKREKGQKVKTSQRHKMNSSAAKKQGGKHKGKKKKRPTSRSKLSRGPERVKKKHDGAGRSSAVKKNEKGQLVFKDFPDFKPNMTPKEVLQAGSFGGTYFRPIYSSITTIQRRVEGTSGRLARRPGYKQVASPTYREGVNTYKVKCGGSLQMWESSGWIVAQDPYGWFHWYCRFYQGRRTEDDGRQISRWAKCAGVKGRWRRNLITKVVRAGYKYDNPAVSPVVRQTLQHWAYSLTEEDFTEGAKRVKLT